MLSREAESLFWMGRYLERTEATARIVDVQYHAALESALAGHDPASLWNGILEISGDDLIFRARYGAATERELIQFMVFDRDQPNSVISCMRSARSNAQHVREVISSEVWEAVNRAYLELQGGGVDEMLQASAHGYLSKIRNNVHLFYGLAERTMLIGDATYFLKTGTFLERADQMSRLTDVLVRELTGGDYLLDANDKFDTHGWIACLKSASAFEAFRKTYKGGITPDNVLSFLILDWDFPSSIHHAVSQVERCLRFVSSSQGRRYANDAERLSGKLHADLSFLTIADIRKIGIHDFLEGIQKRCWEIGSAINEAYLRR